SNPFAAGKHLSLSYRDTETQRSNVKRSCRPISVLLRVLCVLCVSVVNPKVVRVEAQALPRVIIQTDLGNIEAEIDSIHAPLTSANFLRYVDLGMYQLARF